MRRGPGLAALDRSASTSAHYSNLSSQLTSQQLSELHNQLDVFSNALRSFASRHRNDIRRDAEFRHKFQQMCSAIGVDPLGGGATAQGRSSSVNGATGKLAGLWNDWLGLGDWQYELGIQIIDVCVSTRHLNGGIIPMETLIRSVVRLRTGKNEVSEGEERITEDDVVRSIKTLKPLGSGYEVIVVGGTKMVRSVPRELDTDTSSVLAILNSPDAPQDSMGQRYVTEDVVLEVRSDIESPGVGFESSSKSRWSRDRVKVVLDDMALRDGVLWIDDQAHPARYYSLGALDGVDDA